MNEKLKMVLGIGGYTLVCLLAMYVYWVPFPSPGASGSVVPPEWILNLPGASLIASLGVQNLLIISLVLYILTFIAIPIIYFQIPKEERKRLGYPI